MNTAAEFQRNYDSSIEQHHHRGGSEIASGVTSGMAAMSMGLSSSKAAKESFSGNSASAAMLTSAVMGVASSGALDAGHESATLMMMPAGVSCGTGGVAGHGHSDSVLIESRKVSHQLGAQMGVTYPSKGIIRNHSLRSKSKRNKKAAAAAAKKVKTN